MAIYRHNRPDTDVSRNSALSEADDKATLSPLQEVLNAATRVDLGTNRIAYNNLVIAKTGTEFNQSSGIFNANEAIDSLRMACSQCQQVVKFKVDKKKPGWVNATLGLYDMNTGHPLVSPTTSLAKLKIVAQAIIAGEHIRVVDNGGVPLDFAVDVATEYDALTAPGGLLDIRSLAIEANNTNIDSMGALNILMDPFITRIQDLIMASGGGKTKAEIHAIGIAWGLRYIHIGDPSTFNILLKDDMSLAMIEGGVCHIGKSDPIIVGDPVMAHGAKGTTNSFGTTIIMTLRFGAIEIIIDMPGYVQKIVQMTTLEASIHSLTILLTKLPTVTLV